MNIGIDVSNDLITWAINRAGYEQHEFEDKFPQVRTWLEKKSKPTFKQLEKFSHQLNVPFGYLFLETPPKESLPIPFFRTGKSSSTHVSLNVYDAVLSTQKRQDWLVEYLRDNSAEQLKFVGKFNEKSNYYDIVIDIKNTLGLGGNWANSFQTFEDVINHLAQKIEEVGIIVIFNGIVGQNTHRPINVEECRGFVLVNSIAPFMFINAADSKAAQIFTIIHELAHIWIGESAGFDFKQLHPANNPLELLCDKVAAEFLVPEEPFNKVWENKYDFSHLAKQFKVSQIVIARRALDLGKISRDTFYHFYNAYMNKWQEKKDKQDSGGNYYATTKRRLSLRYTAYINQAVKENKLLYRDAYKLTGLKGNTYQKFVNEYL